MRFSIGKLMILVAISGFNFALIHELDSDPSRRVGRVMLLSGLLIVDLLAILAMCRKPERRSLDNFLMGGCLTEMIYFGFAIWDYSHSMTATGRAAHWAIEVFCDGLLLVVLQFLVAWTLGGMIGDFRGPGTSRSRN